MITIDTREFESVMDLMDRRAEQMVPDALQEGQARADSYAQEGARRQHPAWGHRRYVFRRRIVRAHHATAAMVAWMTEHVFYHRFVTFWETDW